MACERLPSLAPAIAAESMERTVARVRYCRRFATVPYGFSVGGELVARATAIEFERETNANVLINIIPNQCY